MHLSPSPSRRVSRVARLPSLVRGAASRSWRVLLRLGTRPAPRGFGEALATGLQPHAEADAAIGAAYIAHGETNSELSHPVLGEPALVLHSTPPRRVVPAASARPDAAHGAASPRLDIEHHQGGGIHRLALIGELDIDSIATFEVALHKCQMPGTTAVVLDLRELAFVDSSGLWTITAARHWCERLGYGFALTRGQEAVQHIFEVTGLSDVLPFVDHISSASHPRPAAIL